MKYTELTFTELVNKIGNSRFFDLPKMLKEILSRLTPQAPKYKVYTALLSQTGTTTPTATVLENTLGGEVVWSYEGEGSYSANLAGAFIEDKTYTQINPTIDAAIGSITGVFRLNNNSVLVTTAVDKLLEDSHLDTTTIEIRVYN